MKTAVSFFSIIMLMSLSFAQNSQDALRYSLDDIKGTARFRSMSGAFGALGGDLTAATINPAASAVFVTNALSFTFGSHQNQQDSNYFNSFARSEFNSWDVNQGGGVFVFDNPDKSSNWRKFTFGMLYDQTADFDNEWSAFGVNPDTTISDYFLQNAQGKRLDEISALEGETLREAYAAIGNLYGFENQTAFLGYESFILDPLSFDDNNTSYVSNVQGGNYSQQFFNSGRGYNGKLAFNFATQYQDILQIGLNLNTHFLRYSEFERTTESVSSSQSSIQFIEFEETLLTTGSGFSFQLGAILKATKSLRLGFNYTSPTWFYMNDENTQFVGADRIENGAIETAIIDPGIVNFFPEYRLQTPWSIGASAAYVIGNTALLSFEYGLKDFGSMRYGPSSDSFFVNQNALIANTFTTSSSYRIGGEYKINQLSLRGGYRFEESPYIDTTLFGDLEGYSFGLGYTFGNIRIDGSFSQAERATSFQTFDVGLTDRINFNNRITDVIFTLTFLF